MTYCFYHFSDYDFIPPSHFNGSTFGWCFSNFSTTAAFQFSWCWFKLCESSSLLISHVKHFQGCCCSPDTLCGLDWQALNSLAAAPICSIITRGHIDCSCLMHQDSSCSTLSLAFIYDSFLLPIIPGTRAPWGFYMARGAGRKLADT